MIPIKIQNIQMGALSADKLFQSLKHLPQNQQRIFEGQVQKQMEEARDRTDAAEKSEKSRIEDERRRDEQQHKSHDEPNQQASGESNKHHSNFIEKKANGTIKHLDVKI